MKSMSHVAIVGMGSSGQSAAKLAVHLGYSVTCIDRNACHVPTKCQFALEKDVVLSKTNIEQIIVSPGVPKQNSVLQQAIKLGMPIVSELNFASDHIPQPIIALTGTNGKSSTVWYIKQMIEALGKVAFLGGNFGRALSEMALDIQSGQHYDVAIVEVSSYQLEWSNSFHANSAGLLNLTPDHLARHGTLEEYLRCKLKIFDNQKYGDRAVVPILPKTVHPKTPAATYYFGQESSSTSEKETHGCFVDNNTLIWRSETTSWRLSCAQIPLLGRHNYDNVAAALLLIDGIFPNEINPEICTSLTPLEHRLEPIDHDGRLWINDSKATNIEATEAALASMTEPITLLLGGAGKQGANYTQLLSLILNTVDAIICFGQSGEEIQAQLKEHLPENISCDLVIDLSSAIQLARLEKDPRPVLLSPACASFDEFTNFEHRGRFFTEHIRRRNTE